MEKADSLSNFIGVGKPKDKYDDQYDYNVTNKLLEKYKPSMSQVIVTRKQRDVQIKELG